MFETIKEVEVYTVIREHITPLSRDNTISPQADNVKDIDDMKILLMIEAGETKKLTIEG